MGPLHLCLQAVLHLVGECSLGKKLSMGFMSTSLLVNPCSFIVQE